MLSLSLLKPYKNNSLFIIVKNYAKKKITEEEACQKIKELYSKIKDHYSFEKSKKIITKLLTYKVEEKKYTYTLTNNQKILRLLFKKTEPNSEKKIFGDAASIHHYVSLGMEGKVNKYISAGNDINLPKDYTKNTPLHLAVMANKREIIKIILNQEECNVNRLNRSLKSPVSLAAELKQWKNLSSLLQKANFSQKNLDSNGYFNIHYAAKLGDKKLVKKYIKNGNKISILSRNNETPLLLASEHKKGEVVNLILKKGQAENFDIRKSFNISLNNDFKDIALIFFKYLKPENPVFIKFIHYAAYLGIEYKVKYCLDNELIDVNYQDSNQNTLLHTAVMGGQAGMVSILLETYASEVLAENLDGKTAIDLCIETKQWNLLQMLVQAADPLCEKKEIFVCYADCPYVNERLEKYFSNNIPLDSTDSQGNTILHRAILQNEQNFIERFINILESNLLQKNHKGDTPISLAAKDENWAALGILIKHVDYLSEKLDINGNAIIHYAAFLGDIGILKKYIASNKEINLKNKEGMTILKMALKGKQEKAARLILKQPHCELIEKDDSGKDALRFALDAHLWDVAKTIIEITDPSYKKSNEYIFHCSYLGMMERMIAYIERGADVHKKNKYGNSILHLAVLGKEYEMIAFLMKEIKLNPLVLNKFEQTALTLSYYNKIEPSMLSLLIGQADCHSRQFDCKGLAPIHYAVLSGEIEIVRKYVQENGDVNFKNKNEETLLHLAVKNKQSQIASILLNEQECQIMAMNKDNKTAIDLATEQEDPFMLSLLMERKS